MESVLVQSAPLPCDARGHLPPRMRVLYVTTRKRTGGWLAEAFAADSASQVSLDEALGEGPALARLRDEAFDVVLVSHHPGQLDAMGFVEGLRAGGSEEPMIVLGQQSEQEMAAPAFEVGADSYVCVNTSTTRNLIWIAARGIERHQLARENRRLVQAQRQRQQQEQIEAERLLRQQRDLIRHLAAPAEEDPTADTPGDAPAGPSPLALPAPLVSHYREMLRAYVIMGSGNMATEMRTLSQLLVDAGVTAQQTMQLHLRVLEELVRGLGSRSSRHVMSRGDRLALELMVYLAEGYRRRLVERVHPPRQLCLPGFQFSQPTR